MIINIPVWPWDRPGHQQEVAVRPMGERRERNPPSRQRKQNRGREAYERKVTQRYAAHEWKNCFKEQRRANNDWRLNATHGTRLVNGPSTESSSSSANPVSSSSASPATPLQGVMLQVLTMSLQGCRSRCGSRHCDVGRG